MRKLSDGPAQVSLHSRFQSALNLMSGGRMITLLPAGKCLQPSSILFDTRMDFRKPDIPEHGMLLTVDGLMDGERFIFRFPGLESMELTLNNREPLDAGCAERIRLFLGGQMEKGGLRFLIEGETDDVYVRFLRPRIEQFRQTAIRGSDAELYQAVQRMAGCGMGLTPSSDDFLCGYISAQPQNDRQRGRNALMVEAACEKTNEISAALLRYAKDDLYSADILELYKDLHSGDSRMIEAALKRVSSFGSSSGCDFLTGMYYGILDSNVKEG